MDDALVGQVLRAHVADAPPLQVTSTALIVAGRRSRRRRVLGYAAGPAAIAGIVTVGALIAPVSLPGWGGGGPPAATVPDAATCARLRVSLPKADIGVQEAAGRVTCYLQAVVPSMFPPGTGFTDNAARPSTAALVATGDSDRDGDQRVSATANVTDKEGEGLLILAVSRIETTSQAEASQRCALPNAKARCQTGPHGEYIEIFDFGRDERGMHGRTIYVYSGHTLIVAGAHNAPETRSDEQRPTRTDPPLSTDQLIALATEMELRLYP